MKMAAIAVDSGSASFSAVSFSRMRSRMASERFVYPPLAIRSSNCVSRSSSSEIPILCVFCAGLSAIITPDKF